MGPRSLQIQCLLKESLTNEPRGGLPPQNPHWYEDSHRMGNSPARTVGPNSHRKRDCYFMYPTENVMFTGMRLVFCQLIMAEFSRREKTPALLLQTRSGLIGKFSSVPWD